MAELNFPADLKYTQSHEWLRIEGDRATIGITDYAQSELGDVVYIELPNAGLEIDPEVPFGTIESVKAVADLFCPLRCKVVEVNHAVIDSPEIVNKSPYGDGWMIVVEVADPSQFDTLLDAEAYKQLIGQG
ncbi:MAG: glycine cleavage system protein GcvH [Abditibacteriales bacterium]|nr:glycine cleavage system protein GcvH [Abditibacteriales bacterium]MDW8367399.1 glycine cleavage system protein GcvH [Abditibacteriales bacterium]